MIQDGLYVRVFFFLLAWDAQVGHLLRQSYLYLTQAVNRSFMHLALFELTFILLLARVRIE
jgi:hypothetical protein